MPTTGTWGISDCDEGDQSLSEGSEMTGTLMGRVSVAKTDVAAIEIEIAIGFDTT